MSKKISEIEVHGRTMKIGDWGICSAAGVTCTPGTIFKITKDYVTFSPGGMPYPKKIKLTIEKFLRINRKSIDEVRNEERWNSPETWA